MNRLLLTILRFSLYTIISNLAMLPTTASAQKMTFPRIDRKPIPDKERLRQLEGLPQYDPESGYEANLNLRIHDLSRLDLSGSLVGLLHSEFDDRTVWPPSDKMPSGFDPQKIMELGKNPGLGIRNLHKEGITGRGVRIAILDQPFLVDHQEYADRLQLYEEIHIPHGMGPQWHGPMVASVAVGKTVGVAPEAELFYIAQLNYDWENEGMPTLRYLVQGIYRLLEINKQLPPDNKIRAISISKGWTRSDKDYGLIAEAVQKAQVEGILMVFTSVELFNGGYDINKLGRSPLANPDDFGSYGPALSDTRGFWEDDFSEADDPNPKEIYVPTDSRTTASPMGIGEYVFDRNGGSSKYPPYIAGIYALVVQADPSITPERFWALAAKTGRTIEIECNGKKRRLGPILDLVRLIHSIKAGESVSLNRKQRDESIIIVPGVGIGDFALGMSKDEVLKKLGRPGVIGFAGKRYTLDNLPRRYRMTFGDISFAMVDDVVTGISVHSPSYKLANGLRVGDSEEKMIEAFDDDEFEYDDKGVLVRIDEKNGTLREITVYPAKRNDEEEDEGQDDPGEGFDPNTLLEEGMNPGLGVRTLHNQGITGAGVHVGLIDMPLLTGHPEYAGRIVSYHCDAGIKRSDSSMHGPAMASLLVGKHCGTAPGAKLHVEAVHLAEADAGHCARALDRFVAYNKSASKEDRIRVVSVSAQPSGEGSLYKNQSLWDESVQRAEAQGILVLDCTWHHGFISLCWLDPQNRENVEACTPGFREGPVEVDEGHIHVPTAPRTEARAPSDGPFGYSYADGGRRRKKPYSKSGYSPTIPYAAGILAMGWQIRPELTPAQMKELLFASAYVHESGAKIINPIAFIDRIRNQSGHLVAAAVYNGDSETQTIVPGVRIGEFTLGMSKDEVLRRLGKPQFIYHGNVRYTLDNLPREYRLYYGDIEFQIHNDAVVEVMAHSPSYTFDNGLTVGDSADKVKQIFGTDFEGSGNVFRYYNKGLRFEFHEEKRTVNEIRIFWPGPKDDEDEDESDAPDKTERKQSDRSKPEVDESDFKAYMDAPGKQVCMDLRGKDLHALDLRFAADILDNIVFDHETLWPPPQRLPEGFDPQILLQEGMNPGLGVRALHAQGITGAGVHVGLIDQPVFLDHPEYAGKIVSYHVPGFEPQRGSSHGTGMASMLVGKRCGTAPGACLHAAAIPTWEHDAGHAARALDRFVEYNQKALQKDKIRVVSVSCAPSGEGSNFKNQSQWDDSVQRAEAQGILVLDATWHHSFVSLCWLDPKDRENIEACTPGFRNSQVEVDEGHIHVPTAPRTSAGDDRPSGYIYLGGYCRIGPADKGGYSGAFPYAAGILALGWQINPDLTPEQIKDLLFVSAYVHESGAKIINPPAFIELVREQSENQKSDRFSSDGFVSMFDGKTLIGWHAVPESSASDWTVRDGAIVGRGSADRQAYLVWKDQQLTDFELRFQYRLLTKGNTGVEIRSQPDPSGKRPFEGYHADLGHVGIGSHILGAWDFHFARREEHPCPRGTRLVIDKNGRTQSSNIRGALKATDVRRGQWNDVRVIARGNHFQFFVNGKPASEFTDNAERGRLTQGAIGLQLHDKGMHVEFKDLQLKRLSKD